MVLYNQHLISKLIKFILSKNGILDKNSLSKQVALEFNLIKDRCIFYCDDFAIRFSKSNKENLSNTIISLSKLQKYDDRPIFLCIVTPTKNYLQIMNSSFIKKVSHSSQTLSVDNIKGSINGSDICKKLGDLENNQKYFEDLWAFHTENSFSENLERIVEKTNNIVGTNNRFTPNNNGLKNIYNSVSRAISFRNSRDWLDLENDLNLRVKKVQNEIAIAAFIDNINIRGRIIEYLVVSDENDFKNVLIDSLKNKKSIPHFKTKDNLGDYSKEYKNYKTETDIKTKILFLSSNPKGYNIDKLLSFLSKEKTVYLIYLIGIDEYKNISTKLFSVYEDILIDSTNVIKHWAGRNSRGVAQFIGKGLVNLLNSKEFSITENKSKEFIKKLLDIEIEK